MKFATTDTVNSSTIRVYYNYCDSEWLEQQEAPYDVETNTINGIDIPTLLQPSTNYELIYDEERNIFRESKTIVDITLSESVNQIDLIGISDKLKIGKVYSLQILGFSSTNSTFAFGSTNFGYIWTMKPYSSEFIVWENGGNKYLGSLGLSSATAVTYYIPQINNYEYIKMNSTYTFNAGTRIIIKEVA